MGGEGSGRKPSEETLVKRNTPVQTPVGTGLFIPDYSGVPKHTRTRQTFIEQDRKVLFYLHDDFLGNAGATTLGETGWTRGAVLANATNWAPGSGEADHYGVVTLNTGTTASYNTFNKYQASIQISGGEELHVMARFNALAASGEWALMFGFADTSSSFSPTDCIAFLYDTAQGDYWLMNVISGAGDPNVSATNYQITTYGEWHLFSIKINDAGTIASFYIDNVLVGTSSGIPTGDGREMGIYFTGRNVSQGSDISAFSVDYMTFLKQMPEGRDVGIAIGA